jgi:riboflavin kinase/FMN adenylyltransferase
MRLYRTLAALQRCEPAARRVATIGVFDGVHLGHQEILRQTLAAAAARAALATVCSFEPMPSEFFAPSNPPPRLTCFRERLESLERAGIGEMFCASFAAVRDLAPEAFVERLLVEGLNVDHVVVGHDFRFGRGREGTLELLREAGRRHGFGLTTVAPVFWRDERISSTAIRKALGVGDLDRARGMLGRDYAMSGRVVHGLGLGKELGFPTANVNLKRRLAPVDGIFAVRVDGLGARPVDGVASVGSRPTVGGGKTLLEVFLFDFAEDVYGRYITVRFLERLREERKFESIEALKRQMHADVEAARAALARRMA